MNWCEQCINKEGKHTSKWIEKMQLLRKGYTSVTNSQMCNSVGLEVTLFKGYNL